MLTAMMTTMVRTCHNSHGDIDNGGRDDSDDEDDDDDDDDNDMAMLSCCP